MDRVSSAVSSVFLTPFGQGTTDVEHLLISSFSEWLDGVDPLVQQILFLYVLLLVALLAVEYALHQSTHPSSSSLTRRFLLLLKLLFKTSLSVSFCVIGIVSSGSSEAVDRLQGNTVLPRWTLFDHVFGGLAAGTIGDVCLVFPGKLPFFIGLIAFAAGHVDYIMAFRHVSEVTATLVFSTYVHHTGAVLLVAGAIFYFLLPFIRKQDLLLPGLAYGVIISTMVIHALVVHQDDSLPPALRAQWLYASVLFFASDVFVAIDQFMQSDFTNKLWGLPLYFLAQLLFALTLKYPESTFMHSPVL
jgi:uncharacterized membrane protein YhhN